MTTFSTTVTIPAGEAASSVLNIGACRPVGLVMPAAWDTADIAFSGSMDGVTFQPLFDVDGVEIAVKVEQGQSTPLDPEDLAAFPYVQLRSYSGGGAVNQTAAADIVVVLR